MAGRSLEAKPRNFEDRTHLSMPGRPSTTMQHVRVSKRRKQNSSCDGCRRARVACDASDLAEQSQPGTVQCSRCSRKKRECTFSVSASLSIFLCAPNDRRGRSGWRQCSAACAILAATSLVMHSRLLFRCLSPCHMGCVRRQPRTHCARGPNLPR